MLCGLQLIVMHAFLAFTTAPFIDRLRTTPMRTVLTFCGIGVRQPHIYSFVAQCIFCRLCKFKGRISWVLLGVVAWIFGVHFIVIHFAELIIICQVETLNQSTCI